MATVTIASSIGGGACDSWTGARSSDDKSLMIVTNTAHSHVDQGPGAHQSTLNEY